MKRIFSFLLCASLAQLSFAMENDAHHNSNIKASKLMLNAVSQTIFVELLKSVSDTLIDLAADKGCPNSLGVYSLETPMLGTIKSTKEHYKFHDLAFAETVDSDMEARIVNAVANIQLYEKEGTIKVGDDFKLESFVVMFRGRGITVNGNFFAERDEGHYHGAVPIHQLPYMSFKSAKAILDDNRLIVTRSSLVDTDSRITSAVSNPETGAIHARGVVAIKLYLAGHSYHILSHEIAFTLKPQKLSRL